MNPFQKLKNKIGTGAEQKNEEQRQRIERLTQLEAAQNHKGFHITNPVQSMKDKKEIKRLKKEIAAFEESKRNTKVIIGCVVFVVALICFCGIMAFGETTPQSNSVNVQDGNYADSSTTTNDTVSIATQTEEFSTENTSNEIAVNSSNIDTSMFEFELSDTGDTYILTKYKRRLSESADYVEIPATYEGLPVTEIASQAFYACDKLKTVIIPEGIIEIGSYAFYHCDSLENITFPTTLRRIKEYAFEGCDALTSVNITWAINIGFRAFCECENLSSIVIGNISNGTSFIDEYAFYQCKMLKSATLEGVTTIDGHAFASCENLETVQVSPDLIKIGDSAFEYCKSLKTFYFRGTAEDYNIDYWPWWNKDTGNYEEIFTG